MTHKRRKNNRAKASSPAQKQQTRQPSDAFQIVGNRIASGGMDYVMDNFIHILRDSGNLAHEPEFKDLYMDGQMIGEVSQRWMKKYENQLATAEKEGQDHYSEVFDEMRIKIIEEMVTPAFRKDVEKRLQALLDRLMISKDHEKLEMVFLLKPMLEMEKIPWGICSLILAIYNRTMQKSGKDDEEEYFLRKELIEAFKAIARDQSELTEWMENPDKLGNLEERLKEKPGLFKRLEKKLNEMVKAFEHELFEGRINMNLFTDEELILPYKLIQADLNIQKTIFNSTKKKGAEHFYKIIQKTVIEILTPDRYQKLLKDVRAIGKTWLEEGFKWAATLQSELASLDKERYEENIFVLNTFMGEMRQLGLGDEAAPDEEIISD